MPAPTSYTESDLVGFMETEVGPLLADLSLDTSDALLEAAYEIANLLGHAISDETDMTKLRAFARWQAWQAAYNAATTQFDLKAGSVDLKRSQILEAISTRLAAAEAAASLYTEAATVISAGSTAYVTSTSTSRSPYAWDEWSA